MQWRRTQRFELLSSSRFGFFGASPVNLARETRIAPRGEGPRDFPLFWQRISFFPDVAEHEAVTAITARIDEAHRAISDQRNELEAKPFLVMDASLGRSPAPESNN